MSRGESPFVAIEAAGRATVSVDLMKAADVVVPLTAPRVDTGDELACVGLGDPVQDSVAMAHEGLVAVLTREHGYAKDDAYALMSTEAHTELGGPTGSQDPDPMHPFRSVGVVTLARTSTEYLSGGAAHPGGEGVSPRAGLAYLMLRKWPLNGIFLAREARCGRATPSPCSPSSEPSSTAW